MRNKSAFKAYNVLKTTFKAKQRIKTVTINNVFKLTTFQKR